MEPHILGRILYVILTFSPVIFLLNTKYIRLRLNNRAKYMCIIYYILIILILYKCVDPSRLVSFVCRFFIYIPSMTLMLIYFMQHNKGVKIFEIFTNLMVIFAVISLFFWTFGTVLQLLTPTNVVYSSWGNTYRPMYFYLHLQVPARIFSLNVWRNNGLFCEATAFCCFLGIAYAYEDIFNSCKNKSKKIILLITIITTGTTIGILILLFFMLLHLWSYMSKHHQMRQARWIFFIFLIIFSAILMCRIIFIPSRLGSTVTRLNDYINMYYAWLQSPLWGHGYMIDGSTFNAGFSNSISTLMVNGGLIMMLVYLFPMINVMQYGWKQNKNYFYFGGIIILLFSLEIIGYAYFTLTYLAFGYALMSLRESSFGIRSVSR